MTKGSGYRLGYDQLGNLLLSKGMITEDQLHMALDEQRRKGGRLGEILASQGHVSEMDIVRILGDQLGIPNVDLEKGLGEIDPELINLIPEQLMRRYQIFPLSRQGKRLSLAMVDPFDIMAIDALKALTGCEISLVIASRAGIEKAIVSTFQGQEEAQEMRRILSDLMETHVEARLEVVEEEVNPERLREEAEEAPVVKFVDYIIENALNERASDIHIEPAEQRLMVRYRIDGLLHEIISPPKEIQNAIISRIKVLSNLDIAERRLPQDGRFTVKLGHRQVDLRVSSLPTIFGEKIVIRLMEKGSRIPTLSELGFDPPRLEIMNQHLARPYGMILLTGPTGSGKSTTLYSALNQVKSPEKNVITVEDPVEFQLKGIYQVQARPTIGLTFASGLRSILRQDPDIIMVGEIRDLETAEMAIRSALTGHMVLSTLHANDAVGTVIRLINMGIEPFLVCSALSLAVAQRLLRVICPACRESFVPSRDMVESLGIRAHAGEEGVFYRGKGCRRCKNTGYHGRMAIIEMLEMTQEIRDLILGRALPEVIKQTAIRGGMMTLKEYGLSQVLKGITTAEEVLRVCVE
ncbi:MAG: Flp pilus assembly complex ATPase component TadA [Candidatus Tectomicrobia bacterium]|uniref:Flp pilus assembly complex ATPase component TadA n=1 Tax=Tectimicrobiota bacterium TaxID=2528274 RepID=A0A932CM38_UNCTE|nr:Flp pilus assembly complex ATPase component TadA [Candidatus Tectomicrobia bacterium]